MRQRLAAEYLYLRSQEIDQSRWMSAERIWGVLKEKESGRKKSKTRSDLWVSFQQSRLAALSSPEHKSWKRCGTQKHNSGSPLLCNDWWNNVWRELLCASCRSFPLYCHSCPFYSLSFLGFLACVFPPFFLSLSPPPTLSLFVASLCWADAIQRANVTAREKCFVTPLLTYFSKLEQPSFWFPELLLLLSTALDSIPKFYGLKWVV